MEKLPVPKKRGRPKGSKNAKTVLREQVRSEIREAVGDLLLTNAEKVVKQVIDQALEGCRPSQKLVIDRFLPAHKAVDPSQTEGALPQVNINITSSTGPEPVGVTIEGTPAPDSDSSAHQ